MATYASAVFNSLAGVDNLSWDKRCLKEKIRQEIMSGFRAVPDDSETMRQKCNSRTSHENIKFAALFIYNNPSVLNIFSIPLLHKKWIAFLDAYVSFRYPQINAETGNPQKAIFLNNVSFENTIFCLQTILNFGPEKNKLAIALSSELGENNFILVGAVLWSTDECLITWHITEEDIALYRAPKCHHECKTTNERNN